VSSNSRYSVLLPLLGIAMCHGIALRAETSPDNDIRQRNAKVAAYVRTQISERHIPALSLSVVRDGALLFAEGFGMANLELAVPATVNTSYSIMSITKMFTATAIMLLVEDEKLAVEDPIATHLPDLPEAWQPVTIRQLLNHTSGISSFAHHEKIPCAVGKDVSDYAKGDMLKEVACLPLEFKPGEQWKYGDTGYHLLGMLIEKLSGKDYEIFLRERILAPLGMPATRLLSYTDLIPNRADGYSFKDGKFANAKRFEFVEFASAGLVSTVLDMAKLHSAFTSERVLKRSTLDQMWTNARLNNGEVVPSYGLGFGMTPFRDRRRVGHYGGGGLGFATAVTHFIDEKLTVVLLTNAGHAEGSIGPLVNEIAAIYFEKD
jgi:CubicO group peptidase (beta-lactamase class C family)